MRQGPDRGRTPRGGVLRHRDFRLFWSGQTVSRFGGAITTVALPLVAVGPLAASTLQVALLQAAAWAPWLVIGLPAGVWVDRLPRRPVLTAGTVAALLVVVSVPAAAWPFALLIPLAAPSRLVPVVVGGVAVSAGVVAGNVVKDSFRQAYAPRHLLGRVITGMQFVNYGAMPLGALLGGLLGTVLGLRPTVWFMTATFVLANGLLLTGPLRRHRDLPGPRSLEQATVTD